MAKIRVETKINGEDTEFLCAGHESLLHVLRESLSLTGTKEGCTTGDCGACSIVLDDQLVPACLVLAAEAQGREIQTIEGIAEGTKLTPVQQQFLEHGALQCGVCTPGFIVAAEKLLEENPDPTEQEARYYLAGNLCRCTGYDKIIKAVLDAAVVMREERA